MVDVTFSIHSNACFFKAKTTKGEKWLGSPEIAMPLADAKAFRHAAENEGLVVKDLPTLTGKDDARASAVPSARSRSVERA